MAKVSGPLYSMSASGKLGDAMVYFGWKGINVVRGWVKPANKMSTLQGNQRCIIGGTGRACGEVKPGKFFAQLLINKSIIPGGQTKQSYLVKYIIDHYLYDITQYSVQLAALSAHTSKTAFAAAATTLGLVDFYMDYDGIATYDKSLGLYLIAKCSFDVGLPGTPYTTNITAWVTADINGMINDFTSVT